jgi:hypothetical protein
MRSSRRNLLPSLPIVASVISLLTLFGTYGCGPASKDSDAGISRGPDARPILQFAAVVEPGEEPPGTEYQHGNEKLSLGDLRTFQIKDASLGSSAMGWPALRFEIADKQREEFSQWTASLVDRRMAVLLDGKVLWTPKVHSKLSGSGIVEFGEEHWTEDDVRKLAARLCAHAGGTAH